jgi:hypothetical protein
VPRVIVLDSGPLGLAAHRPTIAESRQAHAWLAARELSGALIVVPEIADYEIRRELVRARIAAGIVRLDVLKSRFLYLPISTSAMLRAAAYWAEFAKEAYRRPVLMLLMPTAYSREWPPRRSTPPMS